MKKPYIKSIRKNLSIPWYEQIKKEVLFPDEDEPQTYYSIKPSDYVTALTHTTSNRFIILKQYRPAVEDYTFELPSGHMEDGESPVQAMKRELREETGCVANGVTLLGEVIPDTGRLENRLWAFYIYDAEMQYRPDPVENKSIEVLLVTPGELIQMVHSGILNHALDLSVITLAILGKHLKI
jgi:8-oxo-dGTP pyrophosphatase MutT (NUDIX family)